ncbi:MAG: hypothetical protein IJG51_10445 [Synergistaceae bacterium]|nr:hypothetical protein [Synergistaceae bacterium]MBQ3345694.1 hypothetical protein [Synergistaceae bacterium]MBQ3399296.1 hypothetical protein [Synergistaceae bacterium]MBQ3758569.1 hypothetical protein [Synergistaceae bacterium]MBQ4401690.1 hypothetical protein [Synergistaceae bacterium]
MTVREKIEMRAKMPRDEDIIDREIKRAFLRILFGYAAGTVIGLVLKVIWTAD